MGLCTVGDGARGPSCPRYGVDDGTATFPGSSRSFPITDDQPCPIALTERSPAAPDVLDAFDHEARTLRYRTWTRPWVLLPLTVHSLACSRACAARWYLVFLYFFFATRGTQGPQQGTITRPRQPPNQMRQFIPRTPDCVLRPPLPDRQLGNNCRAVFSCSAVLLNLFIFRPCRAGVLSPCSCFCRHVAPLPVVSADSHRCRCRTPPYARRSRAPARCHAITPLPRRLPRPGCTAWGFPSRAFTPHEASNKHRDVSLAHG